MRCNYILRSFFEIKNHPRSKKINGGKPSVGEDWGSLGIWPYAPFLISSPMSLAERERSGERESLKLSRAMSGTFCRSALPIWSGYTTQCESSCCSHFISQIHKSHDSRGLFGAI